MSYLLAALAGACFMGHTAAFCLGLPNRSSECCVVHLAISGFWVIVLIVQIAGVPS